MRRLPRTKTAAALLILAMLPPAIAGAQAKKSAARKASAEQRAAKAFESAKANPLDLRAFLVRMPKGADLHVHLTGAVYAESWIRAADEDGLCVELATHALVRAQAMTRSIPPQPACGEGRVRAFDAFKDQKLYDDLVDAFSMRSFVPYAGESGHDHFFSTFAKFAAVGKRHTGEWVDEVTARAAAQNEQYMELMETPDFSHTAQLAKEVPWTDDFAKLREELLARGLRDDVAVARAHYDQAEKLRNERQHCGEENAAPGCSVHIRWIYQVLRGFPAEQVFAQTLLGFEVASADPRCVGINLVMPEDGYVSMKDYALHMRMLDFLHGVYPKVHITLHAGELAPGLVPPDGLCCHIRLAVEEGHAERIGHGVDVMYEDRPYDLLKEMAKKHVMVEINLSSNDLILGVSGNRHPLPIYRRFRVPVALSTDDEGVSRIDLTTEYVRAAETYKLSYEDLKQMARTGMEHNFLPGQSLWAKKDDFSRVNAACAKEVIGGEKPSKTCMAFLDANAKAKQQWVLEWRFREFENTF